MKRWSTSRRRRRCSLPSGKERWNRRSGSWLNGENPVAVIEVENLRKEYVRLRRFRKRTTLALDGLDLSVPDGGVFGFLGPNASGKTTTIRCLLGLIQPSAGEVRLLGADSTRDLA